METIYEDIARAIRENPATHTVLGGDFNAKIGRGAEPTETHIDQFGLGTRNERGKMLARKRKTLSDKHILPKERETQMDME